MCVCVCFFERRITLALYLLRPSSAPRADRPCGKKNARLAPDVLPRFPSSRLEMPIMSYQDRGVNKILKQQCLLRLSLQVPDGDCGTVQILVWPEIGALLNYGSDGEAAGNAKNR